MLREHRYASPHIVLQMAPRWLVDAFSPEQTSEEAEAWLAQWRVAPDKLAFERHSGWTASNWLHWFSSDNDLWSVGDVSTDVGRSRPVVCLEHDDDPIPFEALRWLAHVGRLQVGEESRVA
jgi:hypothetical protein